MSAKKVATEVKIIKRSGERVDFDLEKIVNAINKANDEMTKTSDKITKKEIKTIAEDIFVKAQESSTPMEVEHIQDEVEKALVSLNKYDLAKSYITYRYQRALDRKSSGLYDRILAIADGKDQQAKEENANKNPEIAPVQRDYFAGEISKEITNKILLPKDIKDAHEQGIIHFHDSDYFVSHIHNCCLINLEDMLQNGTVISKTQIDKPHTFTTACNIATQIIAQVASNQYGGSTISLTHLAPFVDLSRQRIIKRLNNEADNNLKFLPRFIRHLIKKSPKFKYNFNINVENEVKEEITRGIQMLQYQVVTLMTTNGQTPFISFCLYLNEAKNQREKDDLAMIIEEVLKQRIQGIKNEKGQWITPAFPKLLYVLQEDNINKDGKYFYLTQLAAKCTAKRMVPDYISEKIMKENKQGNCYPCMGSVDGDEVATYKIGDKLFVESFERMWNRLSSLNNVENQNEKELFIKLNNVTIWDNKEEKFVETSCITKNMAKQMVHVILKDRNIITSDDHLFETENRGIVQAKDLTENDIILINDKQYSTEDIQFDTEKAWTLGMILCNGNYSNGSITTTVDFEGEDEIIDRYINNMKNIFNIDVKVKIQDKGIKGKYKDLITISKEDHSNSEINNYLVNEFDGLQKIYRHIPTEVFEWNKEAKLAFLAGMIDADGHIEPEEGKVYLCSTNRELAIQQMKLANALGMSATNEINFYKGETKYTNIRYLIQFYPIKELIDLISCENKKKNFNSKVNQLRTITQTENVLRVEKIISDSLWSYDITTKSAHFEVSGIYSHNCRSFLNVWKDEKDQYKFYGRFNKGVVTINLADVALSSNKDEKKFWEIFDERLELCHRALILRYERLKGTPTSVAPIMWQYGALARLGKDDVIDSLLEGGYSSLSIGYAGLYEATKYMKGVSHTDETGRDFALSIMQHINDACDKWNKEKYLGFSPYGTPIESTTYKFAKCLKNRFGIIEGITDKDYITNSYHVNPEEEINAFDKLAKEAQFQKLSGGGAISYVEIPNMLKNIDGIISVIQFIYEHIMYAELNTRCDFCHECGHVGEFDLAKNESNIYTWTCPNCGNKDLNKMNVVRRVCGYIGSNEMNQGRLDEISKRVLHL